MNINNTYPYLVSGCYSQGNSKYFLTPYGEVEIENANDIMDVLLPKCNGENNLEFVVEFVEEKTDYAYSVIKSLIEKLFEFGILTNKYSVFYTFSVYSQNPMLFYCNLEEEDVLRIQRSKNQGDKISECIRGEKVESHFTRLLQKRKTTRHFSECNVNDDKIFGLFYASYGKQTNRVKKWRNKREETFTVPSGGAIFPLIIYLLNIKGTTALTKGLYRWDNVDSFLKIQKQCDIDKVLSYIDGLDNIQDSSGVMIVCADFDRISEKYANKAYPLVLLEAGHVMQNAYLYCAEQNIGFVEILGYDQVNLHKELLINKNVHPVVLGAFGGIK